MFEEIGFWYWVVMVIVLVYVVSLLMMRVRLNRRYHTRRLGERRVLAQHVPMERRQSNIDRRQRERRRQGIF